MFARLQKGELTPDGAEAEAVRLELEPIRQDPDPGEFDSLDQPHRRLEFPAAIKVAAGKINAVTGEPWRSGLNREPQDYMVAPD